MRHAHLARPREEGLRGRQLACLACLHVAVWRWAALELLVGAKHVALRAIAALHYLRSRLRRAQCAERSCAVRQQAAPQLELLVVIERVQGEVRPVAQPPRLGPC